jgi:hypothetical protein
MRHTPALHREQELFDRLRERHPESKAELDELGDLVWTLYNEGREDAVREHGRQILAMIEGTTWAPDGCSWGAWATDSTLVHLLDTEDLEVSA